MDLSDVIYHLRNDSKHDFEKFVAYNYKSLAELFYSFSAEYLKSVNFDTEFYSRELVRSQVFEDFKNTRERSESFDAFLFLVASSVEKLTEKFGLVSSVENLQGYLPESSVRYRLKALSKSFQIENVKNDYLTLFPKLLELLRKAEASEEQPHTQQIANFLVFYYRKAENSLKERGYEDVLTNLRELFRSKDNFEKYPFLADDLIQQAIFGESPPSQLAFENVKTPLLYPSPTVGRIFKKQINEKVESLPNTTIPCSFKGYDKSVILNDVLKRGKANFDEPYGNIRPVDKVLLYCFFNMKKHFFTFYAVLNKVWGSFHALLQNDKTGFVFIDLGCGPLTSGLALGDLHKNETEKQLLVHYIGVDTSESMIEKAKELSQCELFRSDSTFEFHLSFKELEPFKLKEEKGSSTPVVINASYLFANVSLNEVGQLVALTKQLSSCFDNVHFIFQNTVESKANETWHHFKYYVNHELLNDQKTEEKFVYQNSRSSMREPNEEHVYYEVLKIET